MNTKLLLVTFCLFFLGIINAQSGADDSGIAIQGIARDDNNVAKANQSIQLDLEFYYKNTNGQEVEIVKSNSTVVTTDAFGVFSLTYDTNVNNNPIFANNEAYLRISENNSIISDEKLKTVPYSISAANGVPTGSIMPFMGTEAPKGWVLCDGSSLGNGNETKKLKALIGNSVPDLQGMFLRGAGSNNFTNKNTNLGDSYNDTYESHKHYIDLNTRNGGYYDLAQGTKYDKVLKYDGKNTVQYRDDNDITGSEPAIHRSKELPKIPNHKHAVRGDTNSKGDDETAPTHFGVNYIIKL